MLEVKTLASVPSLAAGSLSHPLFEISSSPQTCSTFSLSLRKKVETLKRYASLRGVDMPQWKLWTK